MEKERQEQEEFEKLTDEEQLIQTSECRTKSPWVGWEEGVKATTLDNWQLVVFEERVIKDTGEWLYLVKEPAMSKEDLEKLKKSKPKGMNLAELQPVYVRGWLDYSSLKEGGQSVSQRVQLHQVFPGFSGPDDPAIPVDMPRPSCEKTYVYLSVSIDQSFKSQEKSRPIQDYLVKLQPEK